VPQTGLRKSEWSCSGGKGSGAGSGACSVGKFRGREREREFEAVAESGSSLTRESCKGVLPRARLLGDESPGGPEKSYIYRLVDFPRRAVLGRLGRRRGHPSGVKREESVTRGTAG
jgi:hypothetical protein